jgi:Ca-activated chloride channel family protein
MKVCFVRAPSLRLAALVCALLLVSHGESAAAQSLDQVHLNTPAAAISHRGTRPISVDVDLVLVPAVVTDSLNHPVTTLQKQDFKLFEGDAPQDIKYFAQEDAPISVGILLDTSGSMKNKYRLAQEALGRFFQDSNREDDYFVITYSDKPELLADTTQSVEEIEGELASVVPHGSTPLLDAIYLGLHKLKHARYQRRALLIISDGGDNNSHYTAKEIRKIVEESEVQIYSLGIFPAFALAIEDLQGRKLLTQISQATGGRAEFLSSPERLPEVAAEISRELRSQYILGYRPTDLKQTGKLHRIIVKVTNGFAHPLQVYYKHQYLAER